MPTNDQNFPLTGDIALGESVVMAQNSAQADKSATAGETAVQKNEEKVADSTQTAQKAAPDAEQKDSSETYASGSRKARELGEGRRKLAESILSIAKGDPDKGIPARPDEVKKIIGGDPMLEKYFKKAWPKDYAVLFGGVSEKEYEANEQDVRQAAVAQAKAELLTEQIQLERREEAYDLAQKLGFSQIEADSLLELAEKFEGSTIAGKEIDREEALNRAAYTIRPEKAKVGIPSAGTVSAPPTKIVQSQERDGMISQYAARTGKKAEDVRRMLDEVVEPNLKGNIFTLT